MSSLEFWSPKSTPPTEDKIRSFAKIKPGWRFGEGNEFSESSIEEALSVNRGLLDTGFLSTDVFPNANGTFIVVGYMDRFALEVDLEFGPGELELVLEELNEPIWEESCGSERMEEALTTAMRIVNTGLGSSILKNGTQIHTNSGSLSSSSIPEIRFPSFSADAQTNTWKEYADTWNGISPVSQVIPQFFGNFLKVDSAVDFDWSTTTAREILVTTT